MTLEVLELEGYLTVPEAADVIGVTKQMVHKWMEAEEGPFCRGDVVKAGVKPTYLVLRAAAERIRDDRAARPSRRGPEAKDQVSEIPAQGR